jgi:capsid portal protein
MAKVIKDVVNIIKEALEDEGFQVIIDYVIEPYKGVGNAWLHGNRDGRNIEIEIGETAYRGEGDAPKTGADA